MKTSTKNNLLTSLAIIIFVFTSVAQTKTQLKYFKESNNNFLNPKNYSFCNS